MEFITKNLKEIILSVEDVRAHLEIIIEQARNEKIKGVKLVHGYGSHGRGGVVSVELKRLLPELKRKKTIKEYFYGNSWDISNSDCQRFLAKCPDSASDEDLNKSNPGITIIAI